MREPPELEMIDAGTDLLHPIQDGSGSALPLRPSRQRDRQHAADQIDQALEEIADHWPLHFSVFKILAEVVRGALFVVGFLPAVLAVGVKWALSDFRAMESWVRESWASE
jgi:hypothetical protein